MRCIIVGGGIAGTVAALSLLREGVEVSILEQAREKKEVGAGIQLSSNAIKVLGALGLEPALASCAVAAEQIAFIDFDSGKALFETPLGRASAERYGAAFYQVHRADLLQILEQALPAGVLRLNSRCLGFEQDAEGVAANLASGETMRADIVVGADGIHSMVRQALYGAEDPKFSGTLMWRALVPGERVNALGLERYLHVWSGLGRSAVAYWVRPERLLNFVGMVPAEEVQRESWSEGGDVAALARSFHGAEPRLGAIVDAIDSAFITGLFYRDPLERWTDGRVTLMGDAAHAMAPNLAQGACQSIEDGWVLAQCVARQPRAPASALAEYELRRRPRCTKVQSAARAMMGVLQEKDPVQVKARNGRFKGIAKIDPLSETVWGWLYEYDALREADKPLDQVRGLTTAYEGKKLQRAESQRAFDLWKGAFKAEDVARGLAGLRVAYNRFFDVNFAQPKDAAEFQIGGGPIKGVWVGGTADASGPVLLFFHGGAYVLGSVNTELDLAARMARAMGGRALAFEYRLAPEHPFPAAFDDAREAYRWLLAQGVPASKIVFGGEGAGAGLALAVALALRDAGQALPAAVIALSPWTDLTVSGPTIRELGGHDPIGDRERLVFFAASYFQGEDPKNPLISPLFAEYRGFPPLIIQTAEGEVLRSDATRLAERARAAGIDVVSDLYPDTVHVFPLFAFLPETETALRRIGEFVEQRVGASALA